MDNIVHHTDFINYINNHYTKSKRRGSKRTIGDLHKIYLYFKERHDRHTEKVLSLIDEIVTTIKKDEDGQIRIYYKTGGEYNELYSIDFEYNETYSCHMYSHTRIDVNESRQNKILFLNDDTVAFQYGEKFKKLKDSESYIHGRLLNIIKEEVFEILHKELHVKMGKFSKSLVKINLNDHIYTILVEKQTTNQPLEWKWLGEIETRNIKIDNNEIKRDNKAY